MFFWNFREVSVFVIAGRHVKTISNLSNCYNAPPPDRKSRVAFYVSKNSFKKIFAVRNILCFWPWGINGGALQYAAPAAIAVTIEYSCPGRIRDTELAKTARVEPRAEEEGVKSRSERIGERVGSIPNWCSHLLFTAFECFLALCATFYFDFDALSYAVSTASVSRYGQECGRKILSK